MTVICFLITQVIITIVLMILIDGAKRDQDKLESNILLDHAMDMSILLVIIQVVTMIVMTLNI